MVLFIRVNYIILFAFLLLLTSCVSEEMVIKDKIKRNLVGMNLTYYNIAGEPITYTVEEEDIKSVNRTVIKGGEAWKVNVGEGLSWNIYFDIEGDNIIREEQLFVT